MIVIWRGIMDLSDFSEWEKAQKVTVEFIKDVIKDGFETDDELKAYLLVLSDNMWIMDFKQYAEENNLQDSCQEIYKNYELLDGR
jgi:hypothetical protein